MGGVVRVGGRALAESMSKAADHRNASDDAGDRGPGVHETRLAPMAATTTAASLDDGIHLVHWCGSW